MKKDITPTFQIRVSDLCEDTARLLENDVVERSALDEAISEINRLKENISTLSHSLEQALERNVNLEKCNQELYFNIDKAIKEIEEKSYYINEVTEKMGIDVDTALEILKRI